MRVLVSGAGGYIGSSLIHMLVKNGMDVYAFDNNWKNTCDSLIPFIPQSNFNFKLLDINNNDDVKTAYEWSQPDFVVHLAAMVGFPICDKYKLLAKETNVYGTQRMLEFKPPSAKFILMSTGSVYKPGSMACDETSPIDPPSWYGKTKAMAEQITTELGYDNSIVFRLATAMGISFANTRINLLVNDIVYQSVINKSVVIFESHFMRSFIHVWDVASAIFQAMLNFDVLLDDDNKIFNICHDSLNLTKKDVCEIIQSKTGCKVIYEEINKDKDIRNYRMIGDKFSGKMPNWKPTMNMEDTVAELIKVVPLLSGWSRYS